MDTMHIALSNLSQRCTKMNLTEDALQWTSLAALFALSVSTLIIAVQNSRLSKEVHKTSGKVDLLAGVYADIFKGMLERVSDAMNSEDHLDKVK